MVTLPSLKKLTLHMHNILGALAAPELEFLCVDFSGRDERILNTPSFIHRSSCQLKHLSLWYSEPDTAVELLSGIPQLTVP